VNTEHLASAVSERLLAEAEHRFELVAALAFVEGAERWSERGVLHWFERAFATRGVMPVPHTLREPGALALPLGSFVPEPALRGVLGRARAHVARALAGLLAHPVSDGFVSAAIFAGRVTRVHEQGVSSWRPTPRPTDNLSDIVLSLFVVDLLDHREFYDRHLSVCVTCGRVSFDSAAPGRTGCGAHLLARLPTHADEVDTEPPPPVATRLEGADDARVERTDLAMLSDAWTDDLLTAMTERSGWCQLGEVEVDTPNAVDQVGGYADRRSLGIPPGCSAADVAASWHRSNGPRLVERALVYANNALLLRAPPARRVDTLAGSWPRSLHPDEPAVALGNPPDLAKVVRAARDAHPSIRGAAADVRPGLVVVLSGASVACTIVAATSLQRVLGDVVVTVSVEVRSRPLGALRRVDVALP
jgi:hypothetical protein